MKIRTRICLYGLAFIGCIQAILICLFHPAPARVVPAIAGLLLAHLIADFPLQADWVYRWRICSAAGLALHAAIHVMVTALILKDVLGYWPILVLVGLLHFAVDWLKPYWRGSALARFLLDQAIHIIALIGIAMIFPIQSALPAGLLYPVLVYATLPAILMALWVLSSSRRSPGRAERWMRYHLLGVSKIAGVPLVATLSFWLVTR